MLFNSIEFLIFFPVMGLLLATIKQRKLQHTIILFGSYVFFVFTSNYLVLLLIFTTIWDYYFAHVIHKSKKFRKHLLIISLAGNLGLLGFFKYANFTLTQLNSALNLNMELLNIVLPIGISFYTFHSIGYIIDVYRGRVDPAKTLREYAIFIAFFPQLVAGPILRASHFLPQLREKIDLSLKKIVIKKENIKLGITIMSFGFMKKMFFADNISPLVNEIFRESIGSESFTIILGAIGFGVQIYCDFSGYSDIAIGAAIILGFNLPINFNKPYFATSPAEFWRRWHISLSTWLRDYLYVPLGGNKKSKPRTYINLIIVMLLGGLWHGASWNFVIWGLLHGTYLSVHRLIKNRIKFKLNKLFTIFLTQYLVFLTWIPFRVQNLNDSAYSMYKYVILDFETTKTMQIISHNHIPISLLVVFFVFHIISYRKDLRVIVNNLQLVYWFTFMAWIIILILFFYKDSNDFIYFKF